MHSLHSTKALLAFRLGTTGLLLFGLDFATTFVLGPISIITSDPKLLRWALYALCGLPVTGLFYLLWGIRARCPLCLNPPLVPRRCQKHRTAQTFAGSYRLRVALSVFFRGRFTCPYCGEPTRMTVRDRHARH